MSRLALTAVAIAIVAVACSSPSEEADAGSAATALPPAVAVDTSRIVTLSGDLTELVFELGAGDQVVGVDVTTVRPEAALALPIVGVGRFITAEGVLSADPTLVLGDTQTSPVDALDQLGSAGVTVEILPVPTTFDELFTKIETLGRLLDRNDEATALVERLTDEIADVDVGDVPVDLKVAYIYTRGPDTVLLFGAGMTTNPLIEAAGAIDAGAASGIEGTVSVSAEALIAAAPDVIVVPEEGLSILGGVDAFLEIPGVKQTPAGEARAVLVYPEGDFLTFGPRITESLRLLIDDLARLSS